MSTPPFFNGPGMFNLVQRFRHQHRQRGYIATIGSGAVGFTGHPPTALVESVVKIGEQLAAELVDADGDRLRPIIAKFQTALDPTVDEPTRGYTLTQALRDAYEVLTDRRWETDTISARAKTLLAIIVLLVGILKDCQQGQQIDQQGQQIAYLQEKLVAADLKRAAEANATQETLERIEQQLRQMQEESKRLPLIWIADRVVLREGPSPDSRRVGVVPAKTLVEEHRRDKRWSYVEVLAPDGSKADGVRGWLYRRQTRQK